MTKDELTKAMKDFPGDSEVLIDGNSLNYYEILSVDKGCYPNKEGKDIIQLHIKDMET